MLSVNQKKRKASIRDFFAKLPGTHAATADAEEATCSNSSTDTEEKTTAVSGVANMAAASNANDTAGATVLDDDQLPDDQPEVKKKKSAVKFQQSWTDQYQWLHLLNGKMFCKLCEAAGLKNVFTEGTDNFRTSTLIRHAAGTDHQEACRRATLRTDMSKAVRKAFSQSDEAVKVAMKTVYWATKEHLALNKYPSLMGFLASLKCPYIEHLDAGKNATYTSVHSAEDFLDSICSVLSANITKKIERSPFVSLLGDETTDIAIDKKLNICVRLVDPDTMNASTHFLTNRRVAGGTGKELFEEFRHVIHKYDIPHSKVI